MTAEIFELEKIKILVQEQAEQFKPVVGRYMAGGAEVYEWVIDLLDRELAALRELERARAAKQAK